MPHHRIQLLRHRPQHPERADGYRIRGHRRGMPDRTSIRSETGLKDSISHPRKMLRPVPYLPNSAINGVGDAAAVVACGASLVSVVGDGDRWWRWWYEEELMVFIP